MSVFKWHSESNRVTHVIGIAKTTTCRNDGSNNNRLQISAVVYSDCLTCAKTFHTCNWNGFLALFGDVTNGGTTSCSNRSNDSSFAIGTGSNDNLLSNAKIGHTGYFYIVGPDY